MSAVTSEATTAAVASPASEGWGPRIIRAGRVVAAAGALGTAGQLLFYDVGLGVNFPIAIGLLLLGGWLVRRRTPRRLDELRSNEGLNAWQAWNAGRNAAREALAGVDGRGELLWLRRHREGLDREHPLASVPSFPSRRTHG